MSTISPNSLRKIKEQLNNRKSHYGHDIDDRLTNWWLFFVLLAYLEYLLVYWNFPHSISPEKLQPYL